jgi:DNA polymerase
MTSITPFPPSQCTRCTSLCQSRRQIVRGSWCQGDGPDSGAPCVLFIGEAPGNVEDMRGAPFVGPTGDIVRTELWRVGLAPHTWLTNIIKCHPKDDRDPTPDELDQCGEWLRREVEALDPLFVVAAGRFSTRWALGRDDLPMEAITGIPYHSPVIDRPVLPLIHPASGFHSQKNMAWVMEGFKVAGEMWKGGVRWTQR